MRKWPCLCIPHSCIDYFQECAPDSCSELGCGFSNSKFPCACNTQCTFFDNWYGSSGVQVDFMQCMWADMVYYDAMLDYRPTAAMITSMSA